MSLSRHAYRHALKPPRTLSSDSPWIGDDLIAAAFHRFVHQRRHGSSVPGPMEARRRLAKRRNTALAGFGGAEDIACLFGRNGREHMKWTDHPWQRTHAEPLDRSNYAVSAHETALPFYDHYPEPIVPEDSTPKYGEQPSLHQRFEQFITADTWTLEDARDFVRRFRIDLQRKPEYSRRLFENILSRPSANMAQAIQFLDDPFLNTGGSGNYITAVNSSQTKKPSNRATVLNAVTRALELGLIPADELCLILKALPKMARDGKQASRTRSETLQKWYYAMWKAIGQCSILGYRDLDNNIVQVWVKELVMADLLPLAGEIVIASHNAESTTEWTGALILSSLARATEGKSMPSRLSPSELLNSLDPVFAANCIIHVTEFLVSRTREKRQVDLLDKWQDSLLDVSNVEAVAASQSWTDLPLAYLSSISSQERAQIQQQILARLWALRVLSPSLGKVYKKGLRATDRPSYVLFCLYESVTSYTEGCFLANLLRGIHDYKLPYSGVLMSAVDLKLQNVLQPTGRRTICELENSETSLTDVWRTPALYKGVQRIFHGAFEQMVRRMDLTSPAFVEEALHLARTGDSLSIWFIMRLLRNHAPFQICLNRSWVPIPHPDEQVLVRYHSGPRNSQCPDPYAATDLIHQLAVVFSTNPHLSPRRAYYLTYCLYYYCRRHGSPVYPSLVRALFHAGVVRFRQEKLHVSTFRYDWIMWVVQKFEGDEVVAELNNSPEIRGLTIQGGGHR